MNLHFPYRSPRNNLFLNLDHGLGNQLSLYFAGLAYAQKFNLELNVNGSNPLRNGHSSYRDILDLNLPGSLIENGNVISTTKARRSQFLSFRLPFTFRFTGDYYALKPGFDEKLLDTPGVRNIYGFFHTYAYYDYCLQFFPDLIAKVIFPVGEYASRIAGRIQQENSIAIHIRRGDYLSNSQTLGLLDHNYYSAALTYLAQESKMGKVYVFSDDIPASIELLNKCGIRDVIFPETEQALSASEILYLLSLAPNLVVANSSLSYWSAVLSDKESKVVIPKPFYRNAEISNIAFYRPQWHLIDPTFS